MNHATTLLIVVSAVSLLACGPSDTAAPPAAETTVADGANTTPELAPPVIEAPAVEPFTAEPSVAADAVEAEAAPETPPAPVAAAPSTPAPAPAQPKPAAPAPAPAPEPAAKAASSPAADLVHGQQIYRQACAFCHDKGVAGAPKTGDIASWGPRLAQGMDALYTASLRGKGAMPAKGGNPALSDGDVKAAVDYMVTQSR
ncbi:MAG: c-type cytochrome [Thiobacillus sp.]|nr:c-type cytochrome [Thiobacillus sp.]